MSETLLVTLVVEHRKNAIRHAFRTPDGAWSVADAVALAMGNLMDRTRFPNAVRGGPAELIEGLSLHIEIPVEVDEISQGLIDLLVLGFGPDDPLIGEINGELQHAVEAEDAEVDLVSIKPT